MTPHASPDTHHHAGDVTKARVAVLTVSDSRSQNDDAAGDAVTRLVTEAGHTLAGRDWVPDEVVSIQTHGLHLLDSADALVVTGGTGLAPRDLTPEAFESLFEKTIGGFGEEFRRRSIEQVGPVALLSRSIAGLVRREDGLRPVFIVPGAPQAAVLAVEELILPLLAHLVGLAHGPAQ